MDTLHQFATGAAFGFVGGVACMILIVVIIKAKEKHRKLLAQRYNNERKFTSLPRKGGSL